MMSNCNGHFVPSPVGPVVADAIERDGKSVVEAARSGF